MVAILQYGRAAYSSVRRYSCVRRGQDRVHYVQLCYSFRRVRLLVLELVVEELHPRA